MKLEPYLSDEIIPDLNNIVRDIEDEGDRCYFGSTNDADRLREIADWLEANFRRTPPASQSDEALVEELARALSRRHGLIFDEVCGYEAGGEECDSSTCIGAMDEDHDVEWNRESYRRDARAILPIIATREAAARAEGRRECAVILKGIGKINGDGFKDTTKVGEVVFVWNKELPSPYAPGLYPRVGNEVWAASREQYDFQPATVAEVQTILHRVRREGIEEAAKFLRDQDGYGEWWEAADLLRALAEKQP